MAQESSSDKLYDELPIGIKKAIKIQGDGKITTAIQLEKSENFWVKAKGSVKLRVYMLEGWNVFTSQSSLDGTTEWVFSEADNKN